MITPRERVTMAFVSRKFPYGQVAPLSLTVCAEHSPPLRVDVRPTSWKNLESFSGEFVTALLRDMSNCFRKLECEFEKAWSKRPDGAQPPEPDYLA